MLKGNLNLWMLIYLKKKNHDQRLFDLANYFKILSPAKYEQIYLEIEILRL